MLHGVDSLVSQCCLEQGRDVPKPKNRGMQQQDDQRRAQCPPSEPHPRGAQHARDGRPLAGTKSPHASATAGLPSTIRGGATIKQQLVLGHVRREQQIAERSIGDRSATAKLSCPR